MVLKKQSLAGGSHASDVFLLQCHSEDRPGGLPGPRGSLGKESHSEDLVKV